MQGLDGDQLARERESLGGSVAVRPARRVAETDDVVGSGTSCTPVLHEKHLVPTVGRFQRQGRNLCRINGRIGNDYLLGVCM